MAYGYNLRPAPFGFPTVSPWPQGFQPPPPAPVAPPPQEDPMMGGGAPGGVPAQGPMFPGLAARFPRLAQAGQAIRGFAENFDERFPNVANFRRNNSDLLSNVGMALLTTRPGDNAPVREAFYVGRQMDQQRRAEQQAAAQAQRDEENFLRLIGGGGGQQPAPAGSAGPSAPLPPDIRAFFADRAPGLNVDGMDPTFAGALAQAAADYERETGQRASFTSLVRDGATQAQLYANYTQQPVVWEGSTYSPNVGPGQQGLAAPPGQSRHQHGAAADLPDGPFLQWMQANAARYGLGFLPGDAGRNDPGHIQLAAGGQAPVAQGGINGLSPEQQQFAAALYQVNPEAAMQYATQAMLAQQAPTTYGFEEVGGTLLRTNNRAGTAEAVFTAPAAADTETTANQRDYDRAVSQGYAGTLEQWLTERATAARPQYYENAYDRVTGEFNAEALNTIYQNETLALDRMTNLGLMEQLVNDPTFYSGTGANLIEGLRRFAAAIGVADPAAAVSMETFRALANEATLDAIGGSLGVGISNADRDMIRQMVANMTFSPEGNRLLINIHQAVANRNLEIAELARQYTADPAHPRLDDGFRRMLTDWAQENPLVLPGTEQGGAGAAPAAEAPRPLPQVGEVVDGYRFMGGDPNDRNNWQRVQ